MTTPNVGNRHLIVNILLAISTIVLLQLANIYFLRCDLGIWGMPEVNPLLYMRDSTPYVSQLQNMHYFNSNEWSVYSSYDHMIPFTLVPSVLLSPVLSLLGLKYFFLFHQVIFLSLLFYFSYRIISHFGAPKAAAWICVFFLFINFHRMAIYFSSTTGKSLYFSVYNIIYGVKSLIIPNPTLTPFGSLGRYATRSVDLVIVLAGLFLMLKLQKQYRIKEDYVLALLYPMCFYSSQAGFEPFTICYIAHLIVLWRDKSLSFRSVLLFCMGLLLALIGVYFGLSRVDEVFFRRLGMLYSHRGSLEFSFLPLLCLSAVILVGILKRFRYALNRYLFFCLVSLGLLAMVNQNVITGKEFLLYHYSFYALFLSALFIFIVIFCELPSGFAKYITAFLFVFVGISFYKVQRLNYHVETKDKCVYSQNQADVFAISEYLKKKHFEFSESANKEKASYLVIKPEHNITIDMALEPTSPFFAFVLYPVISNAVSLEDKAAILFATFTLAEDIEVDDKIIMNLYNYYCNKIFTYYFKGAPGRPDIKQRSKTWEIDQIDFLLEKFSGMNSQLVSSILRRGHLKYLVIDRELEFQSRDYLLLLKEFNHNNLYEINIDNLDQRLMLRKHEVMDFLQSIRAEMMTKQLTS
jgi:hypothetical protein